MVFKIVEKRTPTAYLENKRNERKIQFFAKFQFRDFSCIILKLQRTREQTNPKNQARNFNALEYRPRKCLKNWKISHLVIFLNWDRFSSFETVHCFLLQFDCSNYVFFDRYKGTFVCFECKKIPRVEKSDEKKQGVWEKRLSHSGQKSTRKKTTLRPHIFYPPISIILLSIWNH